MIRRISIALLLCSTLNASAQNITKEDFDKGIKPLNENVLSLQTENGKLRREVSRLTTKLSNTELKIESLKKQTEANTYAISNASKELGLKISTTETNANQKISMVGNSLTKTSLYGIIGVLFAILLSLLLYWLLSKRQKIDKIDFIDQLSKTKSSIEESLVKEFGKQTELMDSQLHIIEQQKTTILATPNAEPDHSLALKVADEITLIERNISLMDAGTKGLKQLSRSVSKLKDNLAANGYEMPELLGKPLNRGMHSIPVSTIPDENLESGVEMISKIIKPQVNYNDKMIQAAQIEVSVGY